MGGRYVYAGDNRRTISFPVGGIGSGCIGLDGTGRLCDWEIAGRPSKGSLNSFSHFAVKAERGCKVLDARALNSDLPAPYMGELPAGDRRSNYGYGPPREQLCGLPHFKDSEFFGQFPFAEVRFSDDTFPGRAALSAFNPFIPLDDKNSSLPAAFYEVALTNTTDEAISYTAALSLANMAAGDKVNSLAGNGDMTAILLTSKDIPHGSREYGELSMSVVGDGASWQQYWYRGRWYDNLAMYWRNFTSPGPLVDRVYDTPADGEQLATLCRTLDCAPGQTATFRFLVSWYYPNMMNDWNPEPSVRMGGAPTMWKHYYATQFEGALDVAEYSHRMWDKLHSKTEIFAEALYSSGLPDEALEAVGANISVLKSPTCLRLEDGSFYAFEGSHIDSGSCEGSCTHVWNYAFALPYLFPKLERSMRELDYTYNLREDGGMPFRLQLPLGRQRSSFRPCVDGQMGGVIKTYREWKLGAGDDWLKEWWPRVKKSLEFAWSPDNADNWDPGKTGVILGRQHHTLDMELFGPSSWLNGFYLAALLAGAEMAEAVGEDESAALYRQLYASGSEYTERELWGGEHYIQKLDIRDFSVIEPYIGTDVVIGGDFKATYWNDEVGEIKYQIGEGSSIDQVLAQWMADLVGLGDVLEGGHVRGALETIYKHNYKKSFREHFNPCRIYALNDESGTVICEWPDKSKKPAVAVPYAEETMHGFEYQAASHMIARGMEREGLELVRAVRDRYDGARRNPWNEFECGSNYARSMASYALLLIYSGFVCDMPKGRMGMLPLKEDRPQSFMWSMSDAWGVMKFTADNIELIVLGGELKLSEWVLPSPGAVKSLILDSKSLGFTVTGDSLAIDGGAALVNGSVLSAQI